MIPEISEFSYGFALTNELVGWLEVSAAPVFPSLIEEGRAGGGYDVKLDRPGAPLYLQFKRSECMTRRSAREYRSVVDQGGQLDVPFYRFPITEATKSDQHELLLALDCWPNHVFYVGPRFHRLSEINDAWHRSAVASRSAFISPSEIGPLDNQRHTVAFDGAATWVCSAPRPVRALSSREVLEKLRKALKEDDRPLRARLPTLAEELREAERVGRERIFERERQAGARRQEGLPPFASDLSTGGLDYVTRAIPAFEDRSKLESPEPLPPATRDPKPLEPELLALREASDIAARVFDAQLIIVQPAD
jgi:hypothetical protein